jgi:YidC/Oxa1 family membrane protein insertase
MDRNSIIGLVLIFLILIGFAWYNQPSEAELKARKQQSDSITLVKMKEDSTVKVLAAMTNLKGFT